MEKIEPTLIILFQFLLPGFLTAWVFHALSSYPKQSQFERIVQALIFTILIQVFSNITKHMLLYVGQCVSLGVWDKDSELIASIICAFLLGLLLTYFSNNDKFHCFMRRLNITRETSYASEWFGAFSQNIGYVVLHLDGNRRIMGWPIEWPTEPKIGNFLLTDACWLSEENVITELSNVKVILIDSTKVEMVEFIKLTEGN